MTVLLKDDAVRNKRQKHQLAPTVLESLHLVLLEFIPFKDMEQEVPIKQKG